MSKKHNVPYWFNESTGESRWEDPSPAASTSAPPSATSAPSAQESDTTTRKRPRPEDGAAPPAARSAQADSASVKTPVEVPAENCPEHLLWKRKYLFKGVNQALVERIKMDEVSAFSITETHSAATMTELIWHGLQKCENFKRLYAGNSCILDGMACVGGNTISFATQFSRVVSNELDPSRFVMLQNNASTVMGLRNVDFMNGSILDVAFEREDYDVMFLDPEWGGPDYKDKTNLVLPISDQSMEEFCLDVLIRVPRVSMVALKLPLNYDNGFIAQFAKNNSLTYAFYTEGMKKMSLTLLTRIRGKGSRWG